MHVRGYKSCRTVALEHTLESIVQKRTVVVKRPRLDGLRTCDTHEVFRVLCLTVDFDFLQCATDGQSLFMDRLAVTMFASEQCRHKKLPVHIRIPDDGFMWIKSVEYHSRGAQLPFLPLLPQKIRIYVDEAFTQAARFYWAPRVDKRPNRSDNPYGYSWTCGDDYQVLIFWPDAALLSKKVLETLVENEIAIDLYQNERLIAHISTTPFTDHENKRTHIVVLHPIQSSNQ